MGDLAAFYVAHAFWIWVGLAALLLAIEVSSGTGWLLWPAAAAGATALLGLTPAVGPATAVLVFAVLTIASTLLARRYFPRAEMAGAGDINDNVARLIGQTAVVSEAFVGGFGRVLLDGKEWAADLESGDAPAKGARVVVTAVSGGSRLRVRLLA